MPELLLIFTPSAAQHYLVHLLREKLEASQSRLVVVSSGAIRNVSDTSTYDMLTGDQLVALMSA